MILDLAVLILCAGVIVWSLFSLMKHIKISKFSKDTP
jgi:hypothetical protein